MIIDVCMSLFFCRHTIFEYGLMWEWVFIVLSLFRIFSIFLLLLLMLFFIDSDQSHSFLLCPCLKCIRNVHTVNTYTKQQAQLIFHYFFLLLSVSFSLYFCLMFWYAFGILFNAHSHLQLILCAHALTVIIFCSKHYNFQYTNIVWQ